MYLIAFAFEILITITSALKFKHKSEINILEKENRIACFIKLKAFSCHVVYTAFFILMADINSFPYLKKCVIFY